MGFERHFIPLRKHVVNRLNKYASKIVSLLSFVDRCWSIPTKTVRFLLMKHLRVERSSCLGGARQPSTRLLRHPLRQGISPAPTKLWPSKQLCLMFFGLIISLSIYNEVVSEFVFPFFLSRYYAYIYIHNSKL